MINRSMYFAAMLVVGGSGCDVYRDVLEKAVQGEHQGGGKDTSPPPPLPPVAPTTCGCDELGAAAYDSCMAQVKDLSQQGECGTRYQDLAIACLNNCKESVCSGAKGLGYYAFDSDGGGYGHTENIPCNDALANCLLNSYVNGAPLHCTWNDIELLGSGSNPPAPPAAVDVYCDGGYRPEVETFSSSAQEGRLDIVRIYESRGDHRGADYHPMGDVKVSIDNGFTTTLVLSSYEPTRWHVGGPGESSLRRIIVTGYQEQDVVAPSGVQIERHVGSDAWWELASKDGPSGKENLITASTEAAHVKPTTISYCYRANAFSLR
ncbi:MAG: hypothetical protein SF187_30205 [Deltaproteobacteria bacterium]|nr:hypothetical protein [Deltaproteobacteria bacterium]